MLSFCSAARVLGPAELGVAASVGRADAALRQRPRVAVLVTGDELTAPGEPLAPGGIYSSNGYALGGAGRARGRRAGRARAPCPTTPEGTRAAIAEALEAADVVIVSGGVSVGPARPREATRSATSASRSASGACACAPASPPGSARATARSRSACPATPSRRWSPSSSSRARRWPRSRALRPDAARAAAALAQPVARNPRREQAVRVRLRHGDDGLARRAHRRPGLARAHLDARRRRPGADRPRRRRAGRRRARGGGAAVRPRDPRRLLERQRRARARVTIVRGAAVRRTRRTARIGSKQVAEVTLPRAELEKHLVARVPRAPRAHLLELPVALLARPASACSTARTRARSCSCARPFVLLRFRKPEYEIDADGGTVTWPIDRGVLVARRGRGRGFLRLGVRRKPVADGADEVTLRRLVRGRELLPDDRDSARAAGSTSRPSCAST